MKKISILALFILSLTATNSFAQNGNRNGFGGAGNGFGNNMGGQQINSKSEADIQKERTEYLNKSIEKLKTDLKLDDLQFIVIKREIETCSNTIYKVSKSEISEEDKEKEVEAISEKTNRNIMGFLNEEQKKKYQSYIDDRKEQIEKSKNKRARN
jgi:hypothetical protein